jgi:hypothetical protein
MARCLVVAIVVKGWRRVMRRRALWRSQHESDGLMPLRFTEAIGKERLRGFGCLQRFRFRRIQRSHEHVKISTLSIGRLIGGPPPSLDVATSRLPAFARAGREARTLTDAATQEAAEPLPVAAIDAKGRQSFWH